MFSLKILPKHLFWKAIQVDILNCYAASSLPEIHGVWVCWRPWKVFSPSSKSNSKITRLCGHTATCLCVQGLVEKFLTVLLPVSYKALFLLIFPFPEPLQKEVQSMAFLEVISKLRSHENKTVAQQASLTEQRLAVESWGRSCFQCIPSQISPLSSVLLPLLLCFPLYHLCMRVMFPHKLMNCCRYPSKKVSTNS